MVKSVWFSSGLGLVGLITLAWTAKFLHGLGSVLPLSGFTLTFAVLLGMVVRRLPGRPNWIPPVQIPLAMGMVLVGVQFDARILDVVPPATLGVLLVHWSIVGLLFAVWARRRWLSPAEASVLGVGLSGCGLPAVYAVCSGARPVDEGLQRSAVGLVLLAGTVGFGLMPWLVQCADLTPELAAAWFGIAMTSTSEAVIMGADQSAECLRTVSVLRMTTHVLQGLPILVALMAGLPGAESRAKIGLRECVPGFLWGLLGFAVLSSLGLFAAAERQALSGVTRWALLAALVGIGLQLRPIELLRMPLRLLSLALLSWGIAAAATLLLLRGVAGG